MKIYAERTPLIVLEDALGQEPSGQIVVGLVDATAGRIMYKNLPKTSHYGIQFGLL